MSLPSFLMFTDLPSPKKLIASLAAAAMTLALLPTGFAFSDVSGSTNYNAAIKALESKGVIQGYSDGTFKPLAGINRAEFLKILLESRGEVDPDGKNCFPDVTTQWFAKYVCQAKNEGIVSGYPNGLFMPEQAINFVEASKMLTLAYKQSVVAQGEWYEPYGRALESSNAIPTSIATLDAPLKRAEMAEMMWRLDEGKTDQPAKGFLNVKYPEMKVNLASDKPQLAKSCTDLKEFTEDAQSAGGGGGIMYYRNSMNGDVAAGAPVMTESKAEAPMTGGSTGGDDYSKTNVQVEGVDEGDIVKSDGSYVYVLSQTDAKVRIVDVRDKTNLRVVATISSADFTARELYIDGNTLALVGQVNFSYPYPMPMEKQAGDARMMIWPPMYSMQKTTVKLYDVSNHAAPKEMRTLSFEGNSISSRVVDGKLIAVLNSSPRWYGPYLQTKTSVAQALVPLFDDSAKGTTDKPVVECDRVTILPRVPSPQYLIVATIPMQGSSAEIGRTVILGNAQNIYASLQNLYVAAPQWIYHWTDAYGTSEEKTNVYRFAYTSGGVEFTFQGSVPGHILNQFSMDESGGTFRIATTKNSVWRPDGMEAQKSTNNLYVLNSSLETLGSVTDIAPGESIYSVRFMGNRAYMVTFKQVDPLFVIDLTSARNPKILGKLKIPGYSNYLHPVDENHLLGFGKEVDESIDKDKVHSDDAVYYTAILGMKVSLFDVTDVENPKEVHKVVIGGRGTDSPLLSDHKALLFDKERGLLAFPVTVYDKRTSPKENEWSPDTVPVFQGAYVYDFGVATGFDLKGTITNHTSDEFIKSGDYWYDQKGLDISRVIRVGDSLLTVSEALLTSNALSNLKEQDSVELSTMQYQDQPVKIMQ